MTDFFRDGEHYRTTLEVIVGDLKEAARNYAHVMGSPVQPVSVLLSAADAYLLTALPPVAFGRRFATVLDVASGERFRVSRQPDGLIAIRSDV